MNFEKLSELTTFLQRGISPKYEEFGIPVINQKCIRNGQLKRESVKFHSKQKNISPEKYLVENDILVNSTGVGTLGRVARVGETPGEVVADSHVTIVRPNPELVDPVFLFYALRLSEPTIVSMASGSTGQTELSRFALGALEIPKLEKSAQKFIASTFASIDAKISVNEALAQTLENIAQALFKSWFIDFAPVKAKMAGQEPVGMDAETAALFPDSMEESELGEIPAGWLVSRLGELVTNRRSTLNPQRFPGEDYWHFSIPSFDSARRPLLQSGAQIQSNKFQLQAPCVLVSKLNPTHPRNWLVLNPSQNAIASTEFVVLEPRAHESLFYVNCIVRTSRFQSAMENRVTGSTGSHQRVKPDELLDIFHVSPTTELVAVFADLVRPMFEAAEALRDAIETLSRLRDSLLPRLISGELEIPEEMLAASR